MSELPVTIEVIQGDILDFSSDVLALKYAQEHYGVDKAVSSMLVNRNVAKPRSMQPAPGSHTWIDPKGLLRTPLLLFVGVPDVWAFSYPGIEDFAFQVLSLVAQDHPDAEHIAITLHGSGYGLDEIEALHSEVRGILRCVKSGKAPTKLTRVSIVERNEARVKRLQLALAKLMIGVNALPNQLTQPKSSSPDRSVGQPISPKVSAPSDLQSAEQVDLKPRAFVAMPFAPEMEDVFYYGIQNPVRQLGYVCERVDQEAFTGDVLQQVKTRIEAADIVIADLTGANPNVFLEVGYAWGKARPTVLVIKKAEPMRFDVQGQRCLQYQSIKDLETRLTNELKNLPSGKES